MIDISSWLNTFTNALEARFKERVWFVGLQGSYAREEATQTSDIDVVVILDELTAADIDAYNRMLDTLPHRELICGFLSGKSEIFAWDTADLFQFYYDTKPLIGSLDALRPLLCETAVKRAIKTGVCNLYHGCVHNMLIDKSDAVLKDLYKGASFVVQAICFMQTGKYFSNKNELVNAVSSDEGEIIAAFLTLKNGGEIHFDEMSERLFSWCKKWICQI